jgi:hypothetical protein
MKVPNIILEMNKAWAETPENVRLACRFDCDNTSILKIAEKFLDFGTD